MKANKRQRKRIFLNVKEIFDAKGGLYEELNRAPLQTKKESNLRIAL